MGATTSEQVAAPDPRSESDAGAIRWLLLVLLGAFWLLPCIGLAIHWEVNPQYHFGWFVPALALYAAWHRWRSRPAPGAPVPGSILAAVCAVLAMAPVWLFAQPNPDWPLLNWVITGLAATLTLAVAAACGGWRWLRHFFVPAVLIFVAIPLPDVIESPFTQAMMRTVASVAVALLDLVGVGALQHGNLIEVASGVVGVDEACSGVRSLQGSLMASVVLGELFRFDLTRRAVLVVASLFVAFVTNVIRAGFLAWTAARSGVSAIDHWHDPAGMTILAICVGLILVIALLLDRRNVVLAIPASVPRAHPLPRWFTPAVAVWLGLFLIAVEAWYYDSSPAPVSPWRVELPPASEHIELPIAAIAAFHSDDSISAAWRGDGGTRWLLYFFEWNFGPAFSRVAAGMHNPAVCLPASGRELEEERGMINFTAGGADLPFRVNTFRDGDRLIFAYHGVWQFRSPRGERHGPLSHYKRSAAIQSVLWRERRVGQQSAEFLLTGCRTAAEADAAFRKMLPRVLVLKPAGRD